ncbi:putative E3 ubiquitin ligase complex SCF subunit sconB [Linnemannia elongata]|nr:putative E3 ubiquitin ligase complex SCF subunit sconB [Linnemannia elongata]
MAHRSPSPSPAPVDSIDLLAPSLCLNPDAIADLAPVQPSEHNLLPATFPTLSWSEQSSLHHNVSLGEKRLCYRHRPDLRSKRAADEFQLEELQQDIKLLPRQDQQIISHIWSLFGSAPASHRQLVLSGLLTQCCVPQLSFLSNHLQPLLRIDFLTILPPEISLRILSYLDATSLCHAAQVCKSWRRLADDDVVWHRMCEQHIGLKCTKCGWGLPLLEKKKVRAKRQEEVAQSQDRPLQIDTSSSSHPPSPSPSISPSSPSFPSRRRSASSDLETDSRSAKRARHDSRSPSPSYDTSDYPAPLFQSPVPPVKREGATKRRWKEIYSERLIVERNWRKRNYRVKQFRGHTDGVMCLQFDDSFLITGSYDNSVKVWNIETGECLRTLTGHALCVRALHFDEAKLITGSMDRTLKIWNYHTGQCIRTLQGHTDGVVTLDFDSRILASGSVDATIKIWNFATGQCSTLKGHNDLVNKVQIYKKDFLFSTSDDTTVKFWDIASRTCLQTFTGHVGRVQCLQTSGEALISILANRRHGKFAALEPASQGSNNAVVSRARATSPAYESSSSDSETRSTRSIVVTGGLDNTLKIWDAETGACLNTLFGHEEGVWSLAFDKLRIVSGSLDKTIKVWDTESGECLYTLSGPEGPVTCVGLGDTKVVGGSADGSVFLWDYGARM